VHLDQHLTGANRRLGNVDDPDVGGTGGLEDLDGAHAAHDVGAANRPVP
jgi:hypothetical protein